MNIHPIFVHFPIALFTLYSIAELIRFKVIMRQIYWFYAKAILVISGVLISLLTLLTGDEAKHLNIIEQPRNYINIHANFAISTVIAFGIIAVCYLIVWLDRDTVTFFIRGKQNSIILQKITGYATWFISSPLFLLLVVIGLGLVTLTGTLGGALVYGVNNDPFTKFIAPIFFK